jgi:HK97 gp10 family phage protein
MVDADIKGLKETQHNLEQAVKDLEGPPMLNGMRDATLLVSRDAKINAPVDTGRLRASITPEVRRGAGMDNVVIGVVGSNVTYAPYMELGTQAHFPPVAALETWARRHGLTALVVARAIGRRGLAARRFLQRAFEDNRDRIKNILERAVKSITDKANR